MIKSIVVHDIPIDAVPAMGRWYHRDHSAEIAPRYGRRLARRGTRIRSSSRVRAW